MRNFQKKKRCVVIGANGFVGSHCVDKLVEDGYQVRAFDRFQSEPRFKPANTIEIFKGDFFDANVVRGALKGMDYVIHSFSATTPYSADTDPYSDVELNLRHNVQIFELCVETGIQKLFFISSGGAVYGATAEKGYVTEDDAPLPVSPYGICKLATEHYLHFYQRKNGLKFAIFRLTNPYGPRQIIKQHQGVVPAFIDKIIQGDKVTIFGDGSMTRDYIYIKDAVAMMSKVIDSNNKHGVYNIGSGKQTSLNGILAAFKSVVSREFAVEYLDAPATFLQKTQVSIERYQLEFGPLELMNFSEGLRETLRYAHPELLK